MKRYRFFYHYNKANGKMTIHYRKKCYIVRDIDCFVPTYSKWNTQQPRLVMQGFAESVIVTEDNVGIIT